MKWYFGCNNQSPGYEYLIKAAVESALKNTTLTPCFMYDGTPDHLTQWLISKGVNVIYHRVSFYDELKAFYPEEKLHITTGTFLRCDIPILEKEDDFVLYTDCDVLFLGEVVPPEIPATSCFACAPEARQDDWSVLNAGVMLMNLPLLRESHASFVDFIKGHLPELDTYDQSAYNIIYKKSYAKLPLEYNWKPYWGMNTEAKILHFHGPKPVDILRMLEHKSVPDIYRLLFSFNRVGCIRYLAEFCKYSSHLEVDAEHALYAGMEFLEAELNRHKQILKDKRKSRARRVWKKIRKSIRREK
jgi:hypothetical protein